MLRLVDGMKWSFPLVHGKFNTTGEWIIQGSFEEGLIELWLVEAHRARPRLPVFLSHDPEPLDVGQSMARVATITIIMALRIGLIGKM